MLDDVRARLLDPFLDDPHLTIAGEHFCNDVDVCDASGATLHATWRAWGGVVADWANRRRWPSGHTERWTYNDFVRVVRTALGFET